jgi:hypothetical protein
MKNSMYPPGGNGRVVAAAGVLAAVPAEPVDMEAAESFVVLEAGTEAATGLPYIRALVVEV